MLLYVNYTCNKKQHPCHDMRNSPIVPLIVGGKRSDVQHHTRKRYRYKQRNKRQIGIQKPIFTHNSKQIANFA